MRDCGIVHLWLYSYFRIRRILSGILKPWWSYRCWNWRPFQMGPYAIHGRNQTPSVDNKITYKPVKTGINRTRVGIGRAGCWRLGGLYEANQNCNRRPTYVQYAVNLILFIIHQAWSKRSWCCTSSSAMVCWRASGSVGKDSQTGWSTQNSSRGMLRLIWLNRYAYKLLVPMVLWTTLTKERLKSSKFVAWQLQRCLRTTRSNQTRWLSLWTRGLFWPAGRGYIMTPVPVGVTLNRGIFHKFDLTRLPKCC